MRPVYAVTGSLSLLAGSLLVSPDARAGDCLAEWSVLEGPSDVGLQTEAQALAVFDDGSGPALYVGGGFSEAGGVEVNRIARWDGENFSPLMASGAVGVSSRVDALKVFDDGSGPKLYAGGFFTVAGNVPANRIARWDGTAWEPLQGLVADGLNSAPSSLEVFDDGTGPAIYAGGTFTSAGGVVANRIAKWDGQNWSALAGPNGNGLNDRVESMAVFDDGSGPALYVCGRFTEAGGIPAEGIARWDGQAWSAVEGISVSGFSQTIEALTVFDDGDGPALYAGGRFDAAGGMPANGMAKWDGASWSPLNAPGGLGDSTLILTLSAFDDGSGPALYAGGFIDDADGVDPNGIARWDGSQWSALEGPLATGMDGPPVCMAVFDAGGSESLYVGGDFFLAGGIASENIARWGAPCVPVACFADVTGDGSVDLADLNLVLANFEQFTSEGNVNGDARVNLEDLNAVLAAFGTDCP